MESPWMEKPSRWSRPPNHPLKVADVDRLHPLEAEALPEVSEEEVGELGDPLHVADTWMMVVIP